MEEEDVCMDTAGGGDMNNGGGELSILLLGVDRKGAGVAVGAGVLEVCGKGRG